MFNDSSNVCVINDETRLRSVSYSPGLPIYKLPSYCPLTQWLFISGGFQTNLMVVVLSDYTQPTIYQYLVIFGGLYYIPV